MNEDEKLGGLEFQYQEASNFALFISACSPMEVTYTGSDFTRWNGRIEVDCIFKRLDKVLVNQTFIDLFLSSEVQHLIWEGLDHGPPKSNL